MGLVDFCHRLLPARDWQDRPQLDEVCGWWTERGRGVCALTGIGGAGKTAIVDRFLRILPDVMPASSGIPKRSELRPPADLFVYSFYDAPNPDSFFAEFVRFLRARSNPSADSTWTDDGTPATNLERYRQILLALATGDPCLVVLDGLETIQDDGARGGVLGDLEDWRLSDFLVRVAEGRISKVSLLVTSRFPVAMLEEKACDHFLSISVELIDVAAAISLLRQRGVRGTDDELASVANGCGMHALTVDLAGGYIAEFGGGDPATQLQLQRFDDEAEARRAEPTNPRRRDIRIQEYRFARIAERYRERFTQRDPAALAVLERICVTLQPNEVRLCAKGAFVYEFGC